MDDKDSMKILESITLDDEILNNSGSLSGFDPIDLEQPQYKRVYDGSFNYGLGDIHQEYKKKMEVENGMVEVPFNEAWLVSNDPKVVEIAHAGINDAQALLDKIEDANLMTR